MTVRPDRVQIGEVLRRLLSPAGLADPYGIYRQVRAAADAGRLSGRVLFRYVDVRAALEDRELSADRVAAILRPLGPDRTRVATLERTLRDIVVFQDQPDHRRLRRLLIQAFTPRMVAAARPRIEELTDRLLDALPVDRDGVADLHRGLSYPLPAMVVAALLGIPAADRDAFQGWALDLVHVVGAGPLTPQVAERASQSAGRMGALMARLVAEHDDPTATDPTATDLLGAMITATEDGRRLTAAELQANALFLMTAGHETAANMISNGVLSLLRHPRQLESLRADPSLLGAAAEEMLRYESPVQIAARVAHRDRELCGLDLRKGDPVILMLGAANRDPGVYADPDRFDVVRSGPPHLAFGHGAHFCLGAALARTEMEVVLARLLDRYPTLRLADEPIDWQPTLDFRGPTRLPVNLW
ncbi:MAG TPA: cytochrome P450 [Streptosporangiaceae bacterium]